MGSNNLRACMRQAIAKSDLNAREKLQLRLIIMGCRRQEAEDLVVETLREEGLLPIGFSGAEAAIDPDNLDRILQFLVKWVPILVELLKTLK